MTIRGRGIKRGRGRGRSDPPLPSQSCIDSPAAAAHTLVSPGISLYVMLAYAACCLL